ncbi:4-hydroxy-tetrahydrodipicolinate reductase [Zavarzinia compransoris]|uniref:4-hydroxy-tetrahydrodipicolinate reductase n=1 Tax=Zavarzinia compransoris TaxID=1264899 RepID=A0A317E4D0_9PROT|nr:4-hydroxy-tetrahydrodipicolinate reductase [Zavarzinia compransoris]PWR21070.1 4-hydroxy-tetrahydrodipicolinate reductase [Zavarzinia compransoris]TDP44497.1 dihydrodipicolinate reductase [Zavarzinia compransoris]
MTTIGILGCAGRMGRSLINAALNAGATLAGGTERPGSEFVGADLGTLVGRAPLGVAVTDSAEDLFARADVIIDFTAPVAAPLHAGLAGRTGRALVIGTTGLSAEQQAAVVAAATAAPVVQAANFSLGVNLLAALTRKVATILGPEEWDIEIVEMHHRHKVDAPSGTALALGREAAAGRGVALDAVSDRVRDGHTGARVKGHIGFATLRGGDVVGEHSVVFAADGERVELTHKATDRGIFSRGAVHAALWAAGKPAGLYDMADVLDLG